jgi:DNA-binding NarL/FixJ family response regulator
MNMDSSRPIRIVLVDDHAVVRAGIRAMLAGAADFDLVAEAEDGFAALQSVEQHRPDVVVLDLVLRGIQGLEVLRQIQDRPRRSRVVVLSMHQDLAYVVEALRLGAVGYVLKSGAADDLPKAIRAAARGVRYLSAPLDPAEVDSVARRMVGRRGLYETLTARQREVCQLAAQGFTNDGISDIMRIKRRTVESHRFRMMHRLGLKNQAELVAFAFAEGIIPRPASAAGSPAVEA